MDPYKDLNAQIWAAAKTLDRARLLKYFETNDGPSLRAEFESFDRVTALAAWGLLVKQEDEPRDIYLVRVGWVHALVSHIVIRGYTDLIDESKKRKQSDRSSCERGNNLRRVWGLNHPSRHARSLFDSGLLHRLMSLTHRSTHAFYPNNRCPGRCPHPVGIFAVRCLVHRKGSQSHVEGRLLVQSHDA